MIASLYSVYLKASSYQKIIIALMMNMAAITPPYGIQLFVMKGITNRPLSLIFASVIPFVIALLVTVGLIIAFPKLATWLPYSFY
jgi:C4-dicarboxylate transporter DctM subunit